MSLRPSGGRRQLVGWAVVGAIGAAPGAAAAERLPVTIFSQAEGLAGDYVQDIYQDRAGFLWISTTTGLSRFDGRRFVNYDTRHGLPHPTVNRVLETSDGRLWVATAGGLARLERPSQTAAEGMRFAIWRFGSTPENRVTALHQDSRGRVWVGTEVRLMQVIEEAGTVRFETIPFHVEVPGTYRGVHAVIDGPEKDLWIATFDGVVRLMGRGGQAFYPAGTLDRIAFDADGTLWGASQARGVVYALRPEPSADVPAMDWDTRLAVAARTQGASCQVRAVGDVCVYAHPDPLPIGRPMDVLADASGVWIAGEGGLARFEEGGFRPVGRGQAPLEARFHAVLRDADGSLWLASASQGLVRVGAGEMVSFTRSDGLRERDVVQVLDTPGGELVAVALGPDGYWLHVLRDDGRFAAFRPRGLETGWQGWGWNRWVVRDHRGEWWIPSEGDGLYRYPAVERVEQLATTEPIARYTAEDGLAGVHFFRTYEDCNGDLWVSTIGTGQRRAVWRRAHGRFQSLGPATGLPDGSVAGPPTAFAEDADGRLWLGFYNGGVARSLDRAHRRFELFGSADGVPPTFVRDLYTDSRGRLWIGAAGAVLRVDEPGSRKPVFERLTEDDGLSQGGACCFVEDRFGRLHVGNDRGVDRLDPVSGFWRHLTTTDGLASHALRTMRLAANGDLWFGTWNGLSRLRPRANRPSRPPAVRIDEVRVAGVPWPVPERGAQRLAGLTLRPDERHVTIRYFSIELDPGEVVRYQHRLEGVSEDWSPPSNERSVTFAALPSGDLTFEVRAIGEDGMISAVPATLTFQRLSPVWQRGWFVTIVLAAVILSTWATVRLRSAQRRALEHQRARIASDLHDELGSGLGSIGIVAELLANEEQLGPASRQAAAEITTATRELGGALLDIVWALDTRDLSLAEVAARLAQRATSLFTGRGVDLICRFPEAWPEARPSAAVRRSVLLIGLEALSNTARHAAANHVELTIEPDGRKWRLQICDDGRGLPEGCDRHRGRGIPGMRRRAAEIGAQILWRANVNGGTTVELTFALHPASRWRPRAT